MLGCCCPLLNFQICLSGIQIGFQTMDPDNAQHFSLNLESAVDKVYQRNILRRQNLMLLKFNVYPRFAISRQLSN